MSKALFRICKIFTCNGSILNYYLQVIKTLPREMKKKENRNGTKQNEKERSTSKGISKAWIHPWLCPPPLISAQNQGLDN
jgi:hypothetical protein